MSLGTVEDTGLSELCAKGLVLLGGARAGRDSFEVRWVVLRGRKIGGPDCGFLIA